MKLTTIATIVGVVAGAVAAAICIHGKATTDVDMDETTTETTEVENESTEAPVEA